MKCITLIIIAIFFMMCHLSKQMPQCLNMQAPLIIYKTTNDYSNNIPIILNKSKDMIISYPSITDVYKNGVYGKPTVLERGYLLDNFGLSINSVFTSFTFEEYSQLDKVPKIQELMDRIIDFDPFIEMYNCGKRTEFSNVNELNKLIKNDLVKFNRMK